jgi:hypothetical protein
MKNKPMVGWNVFMFVMLIMLCNHLLNFVFVAWLHL